MLTLAAGSLTLAASMITPSYRAAVGEQPPVVVVQDFTGVLTTTVTVPGRAPVEASGVALSSRAVDAPAGMTGPVTCTYDYAGDDGQPFRETRGGVDGRYLSVACSDGSRTLQWVADSAPTVVAAAGAPLPQVSPAELARQAVGRLPLPVPEAHHNPDSSAGRPQTIVGVPTWLWVSPASFRPMTQTVSAGGVSATVTATPVSTAWTTGSPDAPNVTCQGGGTPYAPSTASTGQDSDCTTTYRRSSAAMPQTGPAPNDRFFTASVTTIWQVSWTGTGGLTGTLPNLRRSSTFPIAVAEVQVLND